MPKKPVADERTRAKEDQYFRERDAALIEKKRDEARRERLSKLLAGKVGIEDAAIVTALIDLGFDADTVVLVRLLPLLAVAWADGEVSPKERATILAAARIRDVTPASPADELLARWLEKSPGPSYFEKGLAATRAILRLLPDGQRETTAASLVEACEAVARASGGFLGIGSVSPEEKAILDAVARQIEAAHGEAARKLADGV